MAPEQAMGGAVGPRTDLYALGVVLHELLSGEVPFAGASALGVLHRHLYDAPVPLRRIRAEVPDPLESLVLRLLAKDPQHRPAGGQDVYRELAALLPAPGAGHAPLGPMDPTRPFLRPHAPWPDRPAPPAANRTPAPVPAAASVDLATAVDEVKRLLDAGRITQAVDMLGGILPAAAQRHGEHSPVLRSLRKQYAATLMEDGQYRRALPELRRLSEEFAAQYGGADWQALQFRYEAAQCLEQLGDTQAALSEYRVLLPYFERYAGADPDVPLGIRRRIGQLLLSVGDRAGARDVLTRLLYDAERVHGPHHPFPAEVRRTLAWLVQVQG
jgi:tetratricopeptide (TPR) repeat protein